MTGAENGAGAASFEEMAALALRPGRVTTWLNHWSLLNADWEALAKVDRIGIDGTLLQAVMAGMGLRVSRSSADLVLPAMLPRVGRVALVGAAPGVARRCAQRLSGHEVLVFDGYSELRALREDMAPLEAFAPELVVVGLGVGLQERVAREISDRVPSAAVCTAGGWIDQSAKAERYFPVWVHRMRLGWAWRIAHEPRRLFGRYTVDAVRFLREASTLIGRLEGLGASDGWGFEPSAPAGRR